MRSEEGSRRPENPRRSTIFILRLLRLSRVAALPKLDVAGSTPVARSTKAPSRYQLVSAHFWAQLPFWGAIF